MENLQKNSCKTVLKKCQYKLEIQMVSFTQHWLASIIAVDSRNHLRLYVLCECDNFR